MNRRKFTKLSAAAALSTPAHGAEKKWAPRYVMSSAMYGNLPLDEVLAQVGKTGSDSIDIWRKVHATHREQISAIGDEAFQKLLKKHRTKMSVSTCYPLGPFRQDLEMRWTKKNGGTMTVCSSGIMGPKDPVGKEAKRQVRAFFEKLKPHYHLAEELGVTMAIENHKNSMLSSPDSIRYFYELNPSKNVGVAFAPHHLSDSVDQIPRLLNEGGNRHIPFIYFQEHHPSSKKKMSEEEQLKQLPGFGALDYVPILETLRTMKFSGLVEVFGHPVPRGIPMLGSAGQITKAINTSRAYLADCLKQ
ncbi:sugar phosphate isomerase/epimerase [Akkermansiaceae bacterium]|jgi:sugar phosphate isomerase/epimerase|nr:sugar phosphate isomerase/epimerase [Akkermansiaceae bacterium]